MAATNGTTTIPIILENDRAPFHEAMPPVASLAFERYRRIALLLLFAFFIALVIIASVSTFEGDEGGYVYNATRMLNGPPVSAQDLRLWWGPGYPLVLIPFILVRAPWIIVKLFNALLLIGAIAYLSLLLQRYAAPKTALIITVLAGFYPPFMRDIHRLSPEPLTVFLMAGMLFHFCAIYNDVQSRLRNLFTASIYMSYLALTKVFFGYVIMAALIGLAALFAWMRRKQLVPAISVCLLALAGCSPHLLYTYHLTGKPFYWGTAGGMQLYWMTTRYPNELGSWFSARDVMERPELAPHREFFATLEGLSDIQRDDAFKKQALDNIRHHPMTFLLNWGANVGRLLFSYPFSFGQQSMTTFFYLVPNMFIVVLSAISIIPAALRPKQIPFEVWGVLLFVLIAFAGSSLVSAYDRQFRPLVPGLCLWLVFIYSRILRIEFRTATLKS
jgi:hypothetical protein